ncbi:SURF1 family protein [Simiduia curdlanivorans]|uniref:SURF1-like protein n=1 Tax=Simiduia curdlanivorans TaxID=1492769 RepID=A0ABV8V1A6_9GAMM|nr:SURF1 family protein [Simiduia curdlanivorans]MDN3638030.1 SURF1 family protein [Simiduia curdlanivorans]
MPSEQLEHPTGASSAVPEKLHFDINIKLITLGLVFLPVLLALGFWQLDRANEKSQLLDAHRQQQHLNPISLNALEQQAVLALPAFTKVTLNANIAADTYWLLDNRIQRGRVGYEVLQIAQVNNVWLLINRGWVAGAHDRRLKPTIALLTGRVNLAGQMATQSKNIMLSDLPPDALIAERIAEIDLTKLSELSGVTLSGLVQLAPESEGALSIDWPTVNISPIKHQAYAFQWFSMAFALVVLLVFANTNLLTVLKQKTTNNKT